MNAIDHLLAFFLGMLIGLAIVGALMLMIRVVWWLIDPLDD